MSKSPLEDSFNLPSLEDIDNELELDSEIYNEEDSDVDTSSMTEEELRANIAKLNGKLAETNTEGLPIDVTDSMSDYMDKISNIHEIALEKFKDLSDGILAMEASQGAKFLGGAVKLLDIAKDAQNSSMDRVIRMAKLQIEKEKHDSEMKGLIQPPKTIGEGVVSPSGDNTPTEGIVVVGDRNALMEQMRNKKSDG